MKEDVCDTIWSKNCEYMFYRFAIVSELRPFYVAVTLLRLLIFTKWKQFVLT
jgi:hypothetical protein